MAIKETKKRRRSRLKRNLLILSILIFCLVTGGVLGLVAGAIKNSPVLTGLDYVPTVSTKVYDINGKLITKFQVENRTFVPLSKISKDLQNAVVAIEDQRFWDHRGIDIIRIGGALLADIKAGRAAEGGSTLTQQLAKTAFLTSKKTITRKIQDAISALYLERKYTKEQILEFYLNEIYMGQGTYGMEAASNYYFGKSADSLTLGEAALLAGFIRRPEYYSNPKNIEAAKKRRQTVLSFMERQGYITREQAEAAAEEPIVYAKRTEKIASASYFRDYVLQYLLENYTQDQVFKGGLNVYTTLDLEIQSAAERALNEVVPKGKVDENGLTQPQAAIVAIDPKTGYILAMVGGRGEDKLNRTVQAVRQPGSAFKPIIYAAALENGFTPASVIDDSPVSYTVGEDVWEPQNWDDVFVGPTTLREALEHSMNVVSVKLLDQLGVTKGISMAKRLGITTLVERGTKNDRNLSLALGGLTRGVTPMEMAVAYSAFANGGIKVEPIAILRVEDMHGNLLERNKVKQEIVLSERTAFLLTDMLKGVITSPGGTAKSADIGRPAAGKTGTTTDNTNAWFIGYTPDLVVSVWIGNDKQSEKMIYSGGLVGSGTAARLWSTIMKDVLDDKPVRDFPVPDGIVSADICIDTGLLATPACPETRLELFAQGTEPTKRCEIHNEEFGYIEVSICLESELLATENCPSDAVIKKRYQNGTGIEITAEGLLNPLKRIPTRMCNIHISRTSPLIIEEEPEANANEPDDDGFSGFRWPDWW